MALSVGVNWLYSVILKNNTLSHYLQSLEINEAPDWISTRRIVPIMKDGEKGNVASNFRPVACLPLMWKIFIGILRDELYGHFGK